MKFTGANKAEADAVVLLTDKLCGFPRKGKNIGGGIHVEIPATYSPGALGWTETSGMKHADFSVDLPDEADAKQKDPETRKKLSAPELAELDALWVQVTPSAAVKPDKA